MKDKEEKGLFEVLVEAITETGLFELATIMIFKMKLRDLYVIQKLGLIKHCNYVVMRNEYKFHIRELEKRLDLILGGVDNDSRN